MRDVQSQANRTRHATLSSNVRGYATHGRGCIVRTPRSGVYPLSFQAWKTRSGFILQNKRVRDVPERSEGPGAKRPSA